MAIDEESWENFEASGKITDYLNYRDRLTATSTRWQESEFMRVLGNSEPSLRGAGSYGTKRHSDRDGFEGHADW